MARDGVDSVRELAKDAEWIVTTGDGDYDFIRQVLRELPLQKECKLAVTHAGSAYRDDARRLNRYDKELDAKIRFIGSDSWYLARDGVRAVPYFGTCDLGPGLTDVTERPIVSHSPSSRATKGTDKIVPILKKPLAERINSALLGGHPGAEIAQKSGIGLLGQHWLGHQPHHNLQDALFFQRFTENRLLRAESGHARGD